MFRLKQQAATVFKTSFAMSGSDVVGYLRQQQRERCGSTEGERWSRMETMYSKRLWHQLTLELLDLVQSPAFATEDRIIKLYENFISDFEHRINPLSLVEIILLAVRQYSDPESSLKLLEKTKEKVKSNDEAEILCRTAIAAINLKTGDHPAAKQTLDEVRVMLDKLPGVTSLHSRFYDTSSSYHQVMGEHASYYREALRYLGCIDLAELSVDARKQKAFTLGLAALLGEGIYNFGELLMHPILESLRSTDNRWLIDTLYAFNSGDVEASFILKGCWDSQMVFTRPAHHRQITFQEISSQAKLPVNKVELLVMKALSNGLVKGSIDEVDSKVHMTWVQPRVMDLKQVSGMKDRLEIWCEDIRKTSLLVENHAHEVLG
ncbi:26S proteasome non-ATPase regulatory subunit 13-like isoform X3 [Acipenser oxyrinchus oxyrinchus]|uniref:26S proteasome non-ATPase regulatory subunit 13 n=1 Tax=Acipenser oxyrinchus oxyrinchus TaxID=40147 RepID=A0AAD8CIU3_ACIOX|nr:26S proteasome non-ATPase regulatory subunit 13-like isoform X3 [Acipenser oxyrinchus oxyrinchus]